MYNSIRRALCTRSASRAGPAVRPRVGGWAGARAEHRVPMGASRDAGRERVDALEDAEGCAMCVSDGDGCSLDAVTCARTDISCGN